MVVRAIKSKWFDCSGQITLYSNVFFDCDHWLRFVQFPARAVPVVGFFTDVGVGVDKTLVDTYELTRSGLTVQGSTALTQFSRFAVGLPPQPDDTVEWALAGSRNSLGQQFLDVRVKATPVVQCQRCMAPMPYPLDLGGRLQVVETEAELDVDDDPEASPDEWIEPVLASTHLDVLALVEDELILGLPYVPMHEHCTTEALERTQQSPDHDAPAKPSPFAVLSQLKKN